MADKLQYKMTKPAMQLYPQVLTPKAFGSNPKPTDKKSYSISFVFEPDHPDVAGQKAQMLAAAKAKWPGLDIKAEVAAGRMRMPFTTGDKMIERRNKKAVAAGKTPDGKLDFLKGKIVFRTASDFPPALGVRVKGQGDIDLTEDTKGTHKDAFYTGCMGLGGFTYGPYDAVKEDDKPGVKTYLDMVHSLNTGKRLSTSGRSAAETFKGVAGAAVDEDPTADTMDDDVPF